LLYPFVTSALEGGGCQHHDPTALPPGKTRYRLYRRLGGPQGRSGRVRKIPGPSSPETVAIPTELPGPQHYTRKATKCFLPHPTRLNIHIPPIRNYRQRPICVQAMQLKSIVVDLFTVRCEQDVLDYGSEGIFMRRFIVRTVS
jgi:hypothetical protein